MEKQLDRVRTLTEMVHDKLIDFELDVDDKRNYFNHNPDRNFYYGDSRTNPTEVNRLMLVLRQEMIKLGKMI